MPDSEGLGGSVAYCRLRAEAYRGRGRVDGRFARVWDNLAASMSWREERAKLPGGRLSIEVIVADGKVFGVEEEKGGG